MLTTEREKKICKKYGTRDKNGHINCLQCPLVKGEPSKYDFRCKANSHLDRKLKEWIVDDVVPYGELPGVKING